MLLDLMHHESNTVSLRRTVRGTPPIGQIPVIAAYLNKRLEGKVMLRLGAKRRRM